LQRAFNRATPGDNFANLRIFLPVDNSTEGSERGEAFIRFFVSVVDKVYMVMTVIILTPR